MPELAIATLEELRDRLDWDLSEDEETMGVAALEDLSDEARHYGLSTWNSDLAPRMVKAMVLRAAARYLRNPDGFTQSRAGDETVMWRDQNGLGHVGFNPDERETLAEMAGRSRRGLFSVNTVAYDPGKRRRPRLIEGFSPDVSSDAGYTPNDTPFPFFADDEGSI